MNGICDKCGQSLLNVQKSNRRDKSREQLRRELNQRDECIENMHADLQQVTDELTVRHLQVHATTRALIKTDQQNEAHENAQKHLLKSLNNELQVVDGMGAYGLKMKGLNEEW